MVDIAVMLCLGLILVFTLVIWRESSPQPKLPDHRQLIEDHPEQKDSVERHAAPPIR